ncbi:TPA: glycosyltransferase, partial [Escherichia coli]|nr:glycosyltransferase [Escherichia coli]
GISDKKRKLFIFIEKILSPFLDKIITVSEQDKKLALDLGVASSEKQVVIHNGMPDITIKRNDFSNSTKVRLISVARFSEQKDHETLFHALKLISTDNWTLTLVGKGPKLENIKKLASDLNIANNILFLGERDDVDNLLSESDVFCLITNWEGLPLSIIEAMRASLPVVATDVGGVSELVEHKKNGLLHSPKNIQELANILDTIINDSDLRYKLGNAGR